MLSFSQFLETFVSPPNGPLESCGGVRGSWVSRADFLSVVLVAACSKTSSWTVSDVVPFRLGRALSYSLANSAFP